MHQLSQRDCGHLQASEESCTYTQDLLTVSWNGPPLAGFNPDIYLEDWQVAFNLLLVRTVKQLADDMEKNAKENARKRVKYRRDPSHRETKRLKQRRTYNEKQTLQKGGGESVTSLRPSFTKERYAIRGTKPKKCKRHEDVCSPADEDEIEAPQNVYAEPKQLLNSQKRGFRVESPV